MDSARNPGRTLFEDRRLIPRLPHPGRDIDPDLRPVTLHQMQVLPGAGHRHIQKAALLLDLLAATDCHVRGDAAVDDIQHEDGIPLLALGRVDRRQQEVVLVEMWRDCLGAGGLRRVQGQFGE